MNGGVLEDVSCKIEAKSKELIFRKKSLQFIAVTDQKHKLDSCLEQLPFKPSIFQDRLRI